MTRTHRLLALLALVAVLLLIVTLRRAPTALADAQFYASIARSEQLHGIGIPSVVRHSPSAVDHVPFYGPVFFTLVTRAFQWFGVSQRAIRLVSLLGALLIVAAAALLARSITGRNGRSLWAVTLLLLTPELRAYATAGTMATLAIGIEMMALAIFVCGLRSERRRAWYGLFAGVLLGVAALTTPRTYLFIAAFFVAGVSSGCLSREAGRRVQRQLAVTFAALTLAVSAWAVASHGGVFRWARYISFILLHEDSDVALLPTATREWLFSIGNAAVPLMAAVCALAAAALLSRRAQLTTFEDDRTGVATFALLTGWIAFVAGVVALNLTFTQTTYIALPLFIVVLAMPYESLHLSPRALRIGAAAVLSVEVALAGIWYSRVAATWDARDPDLLYRFVDRYVPDGAAVVGPAAPYFFAVERSGARYRSVSPRSWADWARWVPVVEPGAVAEARRAPLTATRGRYLLWRADDEVPAEYSCALTHSIAKYEPPANHLDVLGWLGDRTWDTGYPPSVLYLLPPGCPTGYDPTQS